MNLPVLHNRGSTGVVPYDPYPLGSTTFLTTTSPETELARNSPELATNVLLKQSLDRSLADLANSSVATEFARQGRGTYAAARRRKHFFGLAGESAEFIIKPI